MSETPNMDLFAAASRGGAYPKADDLEGQLIMLTPSVIETVPDRFSKVQGATTERATADTVVFDEDGSYETYDDMYWSQVAVVGACRKALKPGNKPMVLGRLIKLPTKATREALKIETADELTAARAEWLKKGGKGTEPRGLWVLAEFSEQDAQYARAYLASRDAFAQPSE